MKNKTWQEQLEKYREEAYNYFSAVKICPTGEEILEYVCDCVELASGAEVDDENYFAIAKILGIDLE